MSTFDPGASVEPSTAAPSQARTVTPSTAPGPTAGYSAPAGGANPTPVAVTCPHCGAPSAVMAPEPVDWSQHLAHLAAVLRRPEDVVTIKVECGSCGQPFLVEHPSQPAEEHLPAAYLAELDAAAAADGHEPLRAEDGAVGGDTGG